MSKRVYCLYRVSTTKQVDLDELMQADIPMQRKSCREFAERRGWEIIREEQENGVSGFKVSAANRDKIQLIKEHAELARFDVLLVFMFDRIGRRAEETPFVVEWLVDHGIEVWSVNEGQQRFDNHTDYLLNYIRYWQASGESKKTSVRTKTALAQMVQDGKFRGGTTAYGYKLVGSGQLNKRKHEVKRLAVDYTEAAVVREVFRLCIELGYGKGRIVECLGENGYLNRDGNPWSEGSIGYMLHNSVYTGILSSGETKSSPFDELKIIDDTTFVKAQLIMSMRCSNTQDRNIPLNTKGKSLLSGNIFCGYCGGRLVLTSNVRSYRHTDGTTVQYRRMRYVCYNKSRHRADCGGQTGYIVHRVDDPVSSEMEKVLKQLANDKNWPKAQTTNSEKLTELTRQMEQAQQERSEAVARYEQIRLRTSELLAKSKALPDGMLLDLASDAYTVAAEAEERVAAIGAKLTEETQIGNRISEFHEKILIWSRIFDICSVERKKMIVCELIDRVTVTRGYAIEITYRDEILRMLETAKKLPKGSENKQ
ncbi:hypothetical protein SDC9_52197 [bioreactor metagenome]|uniref:Recombinase domain-containing protein n=1 Tax=bioreactor metagenome TaxID=1076179 RepID=A0A644WQ91_9ZZZZ